MRPTVSEPPGEGPEELSTNATPPSPTFALPLPPLSRAPSPTISSICSLLTPGVPAPSCNPRSSASSELLFLQVRWLDADLQSMPLSLDAAFHSSVQHQLYADRCTHILPTVLSVGPAVSVVLAAEGQQAITVTHLEEPKADAWRSVSVPPLRVQTPHVGSSQAAPVQPLNCTVPSRPQACKATLPVSGMSRHEKLPCLPMNVQSSSA